MIFTEPRPSLWRSSPRFLRGLSGVGCVLKSLFSTVCISVFGLLGSAQAQEPSFFLPPRVYYLAEPVFENEFDRDAVAIGLGRQLQVHWATDNVLTVTPFSSLTEAEKSGSIVSRSLFITTAYDFLAARRAGSNAEILMAVELLGRSDDDTPAAVRPLHPVGREGFTSFLLLGSGKVDTLDKLLSGDEKPTILADDDSCGRLADKWLDTFLPATTGDRSRAEVAKVQYVQSPHHAILSVYFEEAMACVVSQRAYDAVCAENPQVAARLHPLGRSKEPLLMHVLACSAQLEEAERQEMSASLSGVVFESDGKRWGLAAARSSDLSSLNAMFSHPPKSPTTLPSTKTGVTRSPKIVERRSVP
jgi:hypothetical protein